MSMRFANSIVGVGTVLATIVLSGSNCKAANTTQLIYSFAGDADGEYTDTDLVIDKAGNIYGTSVQGGYFNSGTVFQVAPSAAGWIHTVLYSFKGAADGGEPYKGVTLGANGSLYGTAGVGGLYVGPCSDTGCGVVFKLTNSSGVWTQTVIHSFTGGKDGYGPGSGVTVGAHGNVYGTTPTGGKYGFGVIYQLTPGANGVWTENVIHTFTGGADGSGGSAGRLVLDRSGNIFGVCTTGGANGAGTVYELSPVADQEWNLSTLYAFKGEPDSGFPYGSIVVDSWGNLYGTTYYAGAHDVGSVYKLSRKNGVWSQAAIYNFKAGTDGSGPISTLVAAADGSLYGTTSEGGAACSCGTIFKINPNGAAPAYSEVYRFKGPPDGAFPYNGMAADSAGTTLYGATVHGGASNEGVIFQLTP